MKVNLLVKATYSEPTETLFDKARSFAEMMEVSSPVSVYRGLPAQQMEPGRTYVTDVTALGFAKSYNYHIRIDQICTETKRIETSEWGKGIHNWLHTIQIVSSSTGSTWIDRIGIDGGFRTPALALFARYMYRHRHKERGAVELISSLRRSPRLNNYGAPIY